MVWTFKHVSFPMKTSDPFTDLCCHMVSQGHNKFKKATIGVWHFVLHLKISKNHILFNLITSSNSVLTWFNTQFDMVYTCLITFLLPMISTTETWVTLWRHLWRLSNSWVNSLAPGKFKWNFRHVIFKQILVIDGWGISCKNVLRWMPLDLTGDKSTLVQVMAWCRQATSHYLSHCWPRFMSPCGVTRPQWVNKGWEVQHEISSAPYRITHW